MQDEDFSWDDDKAARNWSDHGVTFEMAREAFKDAFAVEWSDAAQDPHKENATPRLRWRKTACFSAPTPCVKSEPTSSRPAKPNPYERRKYDEENRET